MTFAVHAAINRGKRSASQRERNIEGRQARDVVATSPEPWRAPFWGLTDDGQKVLLHLAPGTKEDTASCTAFFEDLKRRGLADPLTAALGSSSYRPPQHDRVECRHRGPEPVLPGPRDGEPPELPAVSMAATPASCSIPPAWRSRRRASSATPPTPNGVPGQEPSAGRPGRGSRIQRQRRDQVPGRYLHGTRSRGERDIPFAPRGLEQVPRRYLHHRYTRVQGGGRDPDHPEIGSPA